MESRFLANCLGKSNLARIIGNFKKSKPNYREGYYKTDIKNLQTSSGWQCEINSYDMQKLNPVYSVVKLTCVMLHKLLHVPSNMRYLRCMQFRRTYSGTLSQNGSTDINVSRELRDDLAKEGDKPKQANAPTKRKRSCRNLRENSHKSLKVFRITFS